MAAPTSTTKKTSWLSRKISSSSSTSKIGKLDKEEDVSDVRISENTGEESWEVLTIRKTKDAMDSNHTDGHGQGANKANKKSTRPNPPASPILGGRTSAGGIRSAIKSDKKMDERPVSAGAAHHSPSVSKRRQLAVDSYQNGRTPSPNSERNSTQRSSFRRKKETSIKSSSPAPRDVSPSRVEEELDKQESAFSKVRDTLRIRKGKKKKGKVQYTVPELNLPNSKYQDPFEVQPDYSENGMDVDNTGHEFKFVSIPHNKPEYCDHCQQTAWGHHQVLKCSKCEFICHKKCESRVFFKCSSKAESEAVLQQDRTKEAVDQESIEVTSTKELINRVHPSSSIASLDSTSHINSEKAMLARKIREYNRKTTPVHHIHIKPRDANIDYQGFVRVHMCIQRPIHVSTGVTRTSWYRLMRPVKERSIDSGIDAGLETAFYLPTDTNRLVHITNITTTKELIITLLKKFCITDNYKKFSLYEEYGSDSRRLFDEDNPLKVSLEASVAGRNSKIVLRDNLCSTIQWDAFSLPELQNFIIILQREEEIYISRLRECFTHWKKHIEDSLKDSLDNQLTNSEHPLSIKHQAPVKV